MTTETQVTTREYLPFGLTQKQAAYLLKTIWPKAPDAEIIKAALICRQYGLNPLMKHIFLIPFENRKTGETTWSIVLAISATRLIARQKGMVYSYIDGPRVMTEDEQTTIFGQVEKDKIWAIVKVQDGKGNQYPGYGFWDLNSHPYGNDKGNTQRNMAFIRAERNALNKMAPGELPDVDVVDEDYIQTDVKNAITQGKAEFNNQVSEDIRTLWPAEFEPPPAPEEPQTEAELLDWVAEVKGYMNTKTAREFLLLEMKITPEQLVKEPNKVYQELKDKL